MKKTTSKVISEEDLKNKKMQESMYKNAKDVDTPPTALSVATPLVGGGVTHGIVAAIKQHLVNSERQAEHTKDIEPQLNEYVDSIIPELNEKYPMLDTSNMNYDNIGKILENTYRNEASTTSTTFVNSGTTVVPVTHRSPAPGWENFFNDYESGKLHYITQHINEMQNNFDYYSLIDSLKDTFAVGVFGAAIATAILYGPYLYYTVKLKIINKKLDKMEKQFRSQPSQKDEDDKDSSNLKM